MKLLSTVLAIMLLIILSSCKNEIMDTSDPIDTADPEETFSGGATTVFIASSQAFSTPAPNLSSISLKKHIEGDVQFEQTFIKSPALVNGGLGPIFNNVSCINCHSSDGRGRPPLANEPLDLMLIRISVSGTNEYGGPNPVPGFGDQLQDKSIFGYEPEASVKINYTEVAGAYPDGTAYSLRKPEYIITGKIPSNVMTSPRVAPFVFGLGLLEAIPEGNILANADENDINQDGISGRPNYVWDFAKGIEKLGRFGWKANQSTLLQQAAGAYNGDMGITSPYFKLENCYYNDKCDSLSDDPEITQEILEAVEFYTQTLAVPARRNFDNRDVLKGKKLFNQVNCSSCHVAEFKTGNHNVTELSNQRIFPYTDLLLHDMGEGLADNRPDYKADGREWRTPPLWGIGLVNVVNGHTFFLHDGRARNIEEAILWHDGEAEKSKEDFMKLSKSDRELVLKFLNSL